MIGQQVWLLLGQFWPNSAIETWCCSRLQFLTRHVCICRHNLGLDTEGMSTMQGCPSPVCSSVPAVSTYLLCKACELNSASKSVGTYGQSISKGMLLPLFITVLCTSLTSETCVSCDAQCTGSSTLSISSNSQRMGHKHSWL